MRNLETANTQTDNLGLSLLKPGTSRYLLFSVPRIDETANGKTSNNEGRLESIETLAFYMTVATKLPMLFVSYVQIRYTLRSRYPVFR